VIDTREQDALFKRSVKGLTLCRNTLPTGDYSIVGFEDQIAVSRKTVSDLYSSLFADWEREIKVFERMAGMEWKALVIEGHEDDIYRWQDYSQVHPNSMRGRLCAIEIRFKLPVYYGGRKDLERWILDRFIRYYRDKRDG